MTETASGKWAVPNAFGWRDYVDPDRWTSYFHQIDGVVRSGAKSCLIIGDGDGIVGMTLRHSGIRVETVDLRPQLAPSAAGDLLHLPIRDNAFDVVVCAQVLEHLPFTSFGEGVTELARVAKHHVLITLPECNRFAALGVLAPRVGQRQWAVRLPMKKPKSKHHQWELGAPVSRDEVRAHMERVGTLSEEHQIARNLYHRYYLIDV